MPDRPRVRAPYGSGRTSGRSMRYPTRDSAKTYLGLPPSSPSLRRSRIRWVRINRVVPRPVFPTPPAPTPQEQSPSPGRANRTGPPSSRDPTSSGTVRSRLPDPGLCQQWLRATRQSRGPIPALRQQDLPRRLKVSPWTTMRTDAMLCLLCRFKCYHSAIKMCLTVMIKAWTMHCARERVILLLS